MSPGVTHLGTAPQSQQQPSQALPRLGALFGEQSRGLLEFVNGLAETTLVFEGDGKKVVRPADVGVEMNRFPELGDRLVVAAALPDQGEPQADVAPGVVGVQADGLLVLGAPDLFFAG